jgi:hypothetical protein
MTTGMTITENEMENLSLPEFEKKRIFYSSNQTITYIRFDK